MELEGAPDVREEALDTRTPLVKAHLVARKKGIPKPRTRFSVRLGVVDGGLDIGCQWLDLEAKTWPAARKSANEALAELLERCARPLVERANDLLRRAGDLEAAAVRVRNEAAAQVAAKRARKVAP
jgi:hypothetical protein